MKVRLAEADFAERLRITREQKRFVELNAELSIRKDNMGLPSAQHSLLSCPSRRSEESSSHRSCSGKVVR